MTTLAEAWATYEAENATANREYDLHPSSECRPTCICRRTAHAEANARYRARKKEA